MRISLKRILPAGLLIFLLALFSCQKEISIDLGRVTGNDSSLLEKFVLLDTTMAAPNDTVYYYKFVYDINKRVSRAFEIVYNGPFRDTMYRFSYSYTGSDTLPFRIDASDVNANTQTYYSYDNAGRVIKDSSIETWVASGTSLEVNKYVYQAGSVKRTARYVDVSGNEYNYNTTYYQSRAGANIFTQSDTTFNITAGNAINLNYQYDNKPNPFRKLAHGIHPHFEGEELIDENFGDNNFLETYTKREELNPPLVIDIDHYMYTYVYGANGLPKIAWEREVNNGTVDKYIFLYTK